MPLDPAISVLGASEYNELEVSTQRGKRDHPISVVWILERVRLIERNNIEKDHASLDSRHGELADWHRSNCSTFATPTTD